MAAPPEAAKPPRGYFGVSQRLLRGYGPLAGLAVLLLLMALLIPSKVPADDASDIVDDTSLGAGAPGAGVTQTGGASAAPGQPGTVAGAPGRSAVGAPPADTEACPGRTLQVPGDAYSPPCVSFSGSNGASTSKGVTKDTITVAFRVLNERGFQQTLAELAGASLVDTPETVKRTVEAMADYFNEHFQFYGRKLKIEFYNGTGSNTAELLGGGRDKAVADATHVASDIGAFADMSATSEPYAGALAERKVVAFGTPYLSRDWHVKRRPYAWSLATDCSILAEQVASYSLARLIGGNADLAGGPLKGKPRKVAALAPDNSWYQECVSDYRSILKKSGKDVATAPQYKLELSQLSNQAANLIPRLKNDGITTIICGCDPIMPVFISGEANRQAYYPEFINIGAALTDRDLVGQLWNQEFTKHAFGISALGDNAEQPPTGTFAYRAYKSVKPDAEPAFGVDLIYYQMYMLAVGIQGAGPKLTPQTFEQGMFNYPAKFGEAGLWGFGPGDYTPQDDVREIYWDADAVSPYNGKQGHWVNPKSGTRYPGGKFPKGKPPIPAPS